MKIICATKILITMTVGPTCILPLSLTVLETDVISEEESSSEDGGDESEQPEVGN